VSSVKLSRGVSSALAFAPMEQKPPTRSPNTKTDDFLENLIQAF
jgi:hypothetical protein